METPVTYARHLATYISDPSTIRARTREEFGRSPSMATIQRLRFEAAGSRNRYIGEPKETDAIDWQPATFVPKIVPPRKRDYIDVALPQREPEHENPFMMLYSVGSKLIASVARDFGLTPEDITGRCKTNYHVDARRVVATVLHRWGRKSYPEIGRILHRDHSTIIHAVSTFDLSCRRNELVWPSFERHLRMIEEADREMATRNQDNEAEQVAA